MMKTNVYTTMQAKKLNTSKWIQEKHKLLGIFAMILFEVFEFKFYLKTEQNRTEQNRTEQFI